jgi:hypothetical protein
MVPSPSFGFGDKPLAGAGLDPQVAQVLQPESRSKIANRHEDCGSGLSLVAKLAV